MTDWLTDFLNSFASQAGTWFVGLVLAVLGAFSTRIVEKVKFALNRADARAKYYEEMAVDISHFVFIIDRLTNVYYGSRWASNDDKSAIEAARIVLHVDSSSEPVRARRTWETHLARAKWMTEHGYRHLLRADNEN